MSFFEMIWSHVPPEVKNSLYWWLDYLTWRYDLCHAEKFVWCPHKTRRVVIIPCDPWSVLGSRGDEAMITAIVETERKSAPLSEIVIVTGVESFNDSDRFKGVSYVYGWRGYLPTHSVNSVLSKLSPDVVYVLGADCMDGKYSSRTSMTLAGVAAYAAACGAETHLTGFSFNESPDWRLRRVFRVAAKYIAPFNLRDSVSAERFAKFTGVSVRLVSDTAFLMTPLVSDKTKKWGKWCRAEAEHGRKVIGINLNPMLFPPKTRTQQIQKIAVQLKSMVLRSQNSVSLLLIPHDYRCGGDLSCLKELWLALNPVPHVAIVQDILSAPELKELVGHIDALFTCRMHLGIAALGRGKPISGLAYQGKFAGLLRHFDLPEDLIGSVANLERIINILEELIDNLQDLTMRVVQHLPHVLSLAKGNIE